MSTQPTFSLRSTKAELLAAFENMRQKYEEAQTQQVKPAAARRAEEEAIVQKTAAVTPAAIESDLAAKRAAAEESLLAEIAQK